MLTREDERLADIKSIVGTISSKMVYPLYMSFWICDMIYAPEHKYKFLSLRILGLFFAFLINHKIKTIKTLDGAQKLSSFYMFILAFIINIMIIYIDNDAFLYYAGLNLIAIAALSFIPFTRKYIATTITSIYLPFWIINIPLIIENNDKSFIPFFVSSVFIVGTILITVVISYFNEQLKAKEYNSRLKLNEELVSRSLVIKKKTKEAVTLELLSAQFSPQVIKAIKNGDRKINNQRYETNICSVFVDIVGSTNKLLTINRDEFSIVVEDFVGVAINTFLKYDLTIDKFYGDGVLAFSNDPIKRDDYIERTCLASLEIKDKIFEKRDFYKKYWGENLKITIGIAEGSALVGFFGDNTYIKQYSAIGKCLPLAQRLTSAAESNEILISNRVADVLKKSNFKIKERGYLPLKGFESDKILVYQLFNSSEEKISEDNLRETCETCGKNSMFIDQVDGIYVMVCRSCEDPSNKENLKKVA